MRMSHFLMYAMPNRGIIGQHYIMSPELLAVGKVSVNIHPHHHHHHRHIYKSVSYKNTPVSHSYEIREHVYYSFIDRVS